MGERDRLLAHAAKFGTEGIDEYIPALGLTREEQALLKLEVNEAARGQERPRFQQAQQMPVSPDERALAARALKRLGATDGRIAQRLGVKPSQVARLLARAEELLAPPG